MFPSLALIFSFLLFSHPSSSIESLPFSFYEYEAPFTPGFILLHLTSSYESSNFSFLSVEFTIISLNISEEHIHLGTPHFSLTPNSEGDFPPLPPTQGQIFFHLLGDFPTYHSLSDPTATEKAISDLLSRVVDDPSNLQPLVNFLRQGTSFCLFISQFIICLRLSISIS